MLNHVTLMGRLTADPELKKTESGVAFCRFSLAVERNYKNANGEYETDFYDVTAWRGTAEFLSKYFAKGRVAAVDGHLQTQKWTDKSGNKRVSVEVVAESVFFGDSKKDAAEERPPLPEDENIPDEAYQDAENA